MSISANTHEVRQNLAEYLLAAERGEEVLILRRNRPVAKIVALPAQRSEPRPIGLAADAGEPVPASFFEALPEDFLRAFDGEGGAPLA